IDNLDMQITDVEALYQIIENAQRFVKNEEQLTAATFSAATGIRTRLGTDFDPFLLSKNRIVDVSSKGIHIFDAKTGKEVKNVSFKNIGVGRFRNHVIFDQGILLLGTKGLAVIDNQGEVKEVIDDVGKIHNLAINEEIWLVEKKRFIKLSTDP